MDTVASTQLYLVKMELMTKQCHTCAPVEKMKEDQRKEKKERLPYLHPKALFRFSSIQAFYRIGIQHVEKWCIRFYVYQHLQRLYVRRATYTYDNLDKLSKALLWTTSIWLSRIDLRTRYQRVSCIHSKIYRTFCAHPRYVSHTYIILHI